MIIKKKAKTEETQISAQSAQSSSAKIIKPKNKLKALKQKNDERKKEAKKEAVIEQKKPVPKKNELELTLEEYEKIDVSLPEFQERFERRRGERRRGFRRIDERTLVSRALEEAYNIRENAQKEGYEAGFEASKQEIESMKDALSVFISSKKEMYEEMSSHILEIALEVAKKIIKKEVSLSDDVLKTVIEEVFDELGDADEKITLKVNPEDVEFARLSLPEIMENAGVEAKVNVVGDETIAKGSCTVIANNGVIDANFSTQLAVVQSAFGIYEGGA